MPAPTLARRYFFKLAANMASVPVYLVMEAILPRALGPQIYGNYNFATSIFLQLSGFLDMGTSTCFYNSLSRRQNDHGLISFYFRVSLGVFLLGMVAGFLLLVPALGSFIMPDVPLWYAPLAALWAFLTWWGRVLRSMNDAFGATIPSEIWRAFISILGVGALALLFFCETLNIVTLFLQQYLLLGFTALAFWHVGSMYMRRRHASEIVRLATGSYCREFFNYSHPLFVQSALSFGMLAVERWLLQWFDGSVQQGFYALSQKVSMACFLFVSAMTPLLMREFSIAWGQNDTGAMASLLKRFAPLLYITAAYFSCFTAAEGDTLVRIFGGEEFAAATLAVQIMALYPLHQAYGQMAGSIFHASGKTRTLRNITALECVYGLVCAWLLIAPGAYLGFNLGASGLAIKTVSVQFISVNIYLWLASRFIPFSFWRNLIHQLVCVGVLLALAFGARRMTCLLFADMDFLSRFIISGLAYSVAVAIACYCVPSLTGLDRRQLRELLARFTRRDIR